MPLTHKYVKPRRKRRSFAGNQWARKQPIPAEPSPAGEEADDASQENADEICESASATKLKTFSFDDSRSGESDQETQDSDSDPDDAIDDSRQRRLVDIASVNTLLSSAAACITCGEASLSMNEIDRKGLVPIVAVICSSCGNEVRGALS